MNKFAGAGLRGAAVAVAGLLVLSACGDDEPKKAPASRPPGGAQPSGPAAPPVQRSSPLPLKEGTGRLELTALSRTSATTVTGQFKVVNDGQTAIKLGYSLADPANDKDRGGSFYVSGFGLLDARNNKFYRPLKGTDASCLCSKPPETLAPGASADLYAVFPAPPADVTTITVATPVALPFQEVPLGQGQVKPLPDQTVDPANAQLAPPSVLQVNSVAEGIEQSVDEDADNRNVRLSSDVLFALNKADLTPRADALLKEVAQQIDASKGPTVKVDGHADNSGNDAINQPLSQRRAQNVADRLKSLVTRQGVTFQTAGHGSSQPIADNGSEEGRRKNRRVAVSFPKPPPPPAAPTSGQPYKSGDKQVLASGKIEPSNGLAYEINNLHRDATGLTTLVWTLKNTGSAEVDLNNFERNVLLHGSYPTKRGASTGGVMLVDPAAKMRYWPLETSAGTCLCSGFTNDAKDKLGPGDSVVLWNTYKPPAQLKSVEVAIPWNIKPGANATGLTIN
ncbi:OmpA family protein [Spirillospora sp. NPDC050679]